MYITGETTIDGMMVYQQEVAVVKRKYVIICALSLLFALLMAFSYSDSIGLYLQRILFENNLLFYILFAANIVFVFLWARLAKRQSLRETRHPDSNPSGSAAQKVFFVLGPLIFPFFLFIFPIALIFW